MQRISTDQKTPMKDVLVLQAARLGDLVQTRRLVLSLMRYFQVHLGIDQGLSPLAELAYPDAVLHPLRIHAGPDMANLAFNREAFARLRQIPFKRVYNCNFSPITGVICRLFAPEKVCGYRPWRCSEGGLARSPWARIGFQTASMRASSPLNLVDFWGWFAENPLPPAAVNPAAHGRGGGLGVAIAGREERRSIPLDTLALMIPIICKSRGYAEVRLFGTAQDGRRARKLLRLLPAGLAACTRDLCGRTDLRELAREVASLDLLLTPDTGIMHIAAWLGVPVLAVFLSSAWCHETGPYGGGHMILQSAQKCSPCLETAICPNNMACADPFRDPGFARLLALLLAGKPCQAPAGIQVWKTGFDQLGAKLELVAGSDRDAKARAYCREIISAWNGLNADQADDDEYLSLLRKFVPEAAWMLPPWRYC